MELIPNASTAVGRTFIGLYFEITAAVLAVGAIPRARQRLARLRTRITATAAGLTRTSSARCLLVSVFVIFPRPGARSTMASTGGRNAMETGFALSQIDTTTPHPARIYDALLGGKDNYAADRQAVRQLLAAAPEARDSARANRAFLRRAVRFLAAEAGIRQIIDIGTGIPSAGNVHEVAAQVAPGTRVAYVDNDPIVHVHANALLTGSGTTSIILADLREPEAILAHPKVRALIDFTQPVALLLVAILHFLTDPEDPARILAAFRQALPAGSYLALSHATADFRPAAARQAAAVYDQATSPVTLRTRAQVTALFDGWDLVEPGLVQVPLWRPDGRPPRPRELERVWVYGGVARKSP